MTTQESERRQATLSSTKQRSIHTPPQPLTPVPQLELRGLPELFSKFLRNKVPKNPDFQRERDDKQGVMSHRVSLGKPLP